MKLKILCAMLAVVLPACLCGQVVIGQQDFYKEEGIVYAKSNDAPFTGIIEYKFSRGEIESQRVYENGILHGVTNSWYVDGTPSKSSTYANGKLHGAFSAWHRNGQLSYQGNYKDGKQDGVWKRWDEAGNLISEQIYNANEERKFVLAPPKPPA